MALRVLLQELLIEAVERLGSRFLPRNLNRARKLFGRLLPGQAGDVDIENIRLRCECMQYDPELEKAFVGEIGSTSQTYSEAEARKTLKVLREKLRELENKCEQCESAYDWSGILDTAAERGVESIHRLRPGG
jgi:hypothetical protein